MGCASAKDVHTSIITPYVSSIKPTNIMELDQLFLLISKHLREFESIKQSVSSNIINLNYLTKANLINNPKLSDAYTLFLWGVSVCNQGLSLKRGVACRISLEQGFRYNLGLCAEIKLLWFAQIFNEFILNVAQGKKANPERKAKIQELLEKVQLQRDLIANFVSIHEKQGASVKVDHNILQINRILLQMDEFQTQLVNYEHQLSELQLLNESLKSNCDIMGAKIYQDLEAIEEEGRFRLRTKMNNIVLLHWSGKKRSQEEEQQHYNVKLERSKERPKQMPYDYEKHLHTTRFPHKLRWTGCSFVDIQISEVSMFLEELNQLTTSLIDTRNKIRKLSGCYKLKEDTILEAWRLLCWAVSPQALADAKRHGSFSQLAGIQTENANAKQLAEWFAKYAELVSPQKIEGISAKWDVFPSEVLGILKNWKDGTFRSDKSFKVINPHSQYNVMSNLAKCYYILGSYLSKIQLTYQNELQQYFSESRIFFEKSEEVAKLCGAQWGEAQNVPFDALVLRMHRGPLKDEEEIEREQEELC